MTYSIIPPIVLILSLIGIILFLLKKAPQLSTLEVEKREDRRVHTDRLFQKAPKSETGLNGTAASHRMLSVLEKITRRFRLVFLKLGNKFTSWNESIRIKRRQQQIENEPSAIEGAKEKAPGRPEENRFFRRKNRVGIDVQPEVPKMEEDKIYRPMISEELIIPQVPRGEIRDRLEKLLIERIAANPKDTEAYERLGEYYFEIGNYGYAKECFKQVIKLNPANMDVKMRMKKLERLLAR